MPKLHREYHRINCHRNEWIGDLNKADRSVGPRVFRVATTHWTFSLFISIVLYTMPSFTLATASRRLCWIRSAFVSQSSPSPHTTMHLGAYYKYFVISLDTYFAVKTTALLSPWFGTSIVLCNSLCSCLSLHNL